jgi:hypothetical protein
LVEEYSFLGGLSLVDVVVEEDMGFVDEVVKEDMGVD